MALEISVADSPIKRALDVYFDFIRRLASPTGTDKLCLNNTITTFDIIKGAPLYTEAVFRAYADRKVTTSPSEYGFEFADKGERYSYAYKSVLEAIVADIDSSLGTEDKEEIKELKKELRLVEKELSKAYDDMSQLWLDYCTKNSINPTDKDYLEKQIAFYTSFGFSTKVRNLKREILGYHQDIRNIRLRAYPDADARILSDFNLKAQVAENEMARPNSPILEAERGYTYLQLSQMWIYGNLGAAFDSSAEIFPSGELTYFLERSGKRKVEISNSGEVTHTHEQEWKTKGAGAYKFFRIDADIASQKKLEESIRKVESVSVEFDNLAEYFVRRGDWFSSTVFEMDRFKQYFEDNPKVAAKLSHVISSLILGRGLKLVFTFASEEALTAWDNVDVKSDFSLSIFGFKIPAGQATYQHKDMTKMVDRASKQIVFLDDPLHCRLLGFRVEKLYDIPDELIGYTVNRWEDTIRESLQDVKDGKTPFFNAIAEAESRLSTRSRPIS